MELKVPSTAPNACNLYMLIILDGIERAYICHGFSSDILYDNPWWNWKSSGDIFTTLPSAVSIILDGIERKGFLRFIVNINEKLDNPWWNWKLYTVTLYGSPSLAGGIILDGIESRGCLTLEELMEYTIILDGIERPNLGFSPGLLIAW